MSEGEAPGALRLFLVDDEAPARERLKELLDDIAGRLPTQVVGEAQNGLQALDRLPAANARVLLADIQMPGMGGLELARHLAALPRPPAVVFVTAHERHAVEAFELNAIDYLLKPVRAERLEAALRKAGGGAFPGPERLSEALRKADGPARQHIAVNERNRIVLVPVRQVLFLRAEQKYVTVRTAQSEYLVEESLVALEREFPEHFVRIHRNCLVARAAIAGFERVSAGADEDPHWAVVLQGLPERLPVSRRQWPVVKDLLADPA